MKKSALVFDDFAFRKIKNEEKNIKRPINKSLFETFGYFLPNYDFEILEKAKDKIVQNLKDRFTDDILFENSIFISLIIYSYFRFYIFNSNNVTNSNI